MLNRCPLKWLTFPMIDFENMIMISYQQGSQGIYKTNTCQWLANMNLR